MSGPDEYLRSYEMPHLAMLEGNLCAACFPLMKMMAARFILERAERRGQLPRGGHVVETTSGTFGLALGILAACRHYRLSLVTASSLIDENVRRRLDYLGAETIVIEDQAGDGNQAERLTALHKVLDQNPAAYWPNQYGNPDNRLAYARFAEFVVRNLGRIDLLVGCVGSGGSLCGTGHFLRRIFPDVRIVAVDTHRSALFGHPVGRRMLRGLGNSIVPANLLHRQIDQVHWVGALVAYAACHRLLGSHGLFMGPTSGAAFAVGRWLAKRYPDRMILVILPDEGHRYISTAYSRDWLETIPGWPGTVARGPRRTTIIAPGSEGEWIRFSWRRRAMAAVSPLQKGSRTDGYSA